MGLASPLPPGHGNRAPPASGDLPHPDPHGTRSSRPIEAEEHEDVGPVQRDIDPVEVEEIAVVGVDALAAEEWRAWPAKEVREQRLSLRTGCTPRRPEGFGGDEGQRGG